MKRKIGLGDVTIGKSAIDNVVKVLESGRLSYGDYSRKFEKEFAKLHGRKYGIFCNSGTSGLQVALDALKKIHGWQDGDEVIVPALTFVATVNVVLQNNLKPVFVDIEPKYFMMNPDKLESVISKRTRAVIPVHIMGQSADMRPIKRIARKHDLKILEDSCEAMLCEYEHKPIGSLGDVAVFSTYSAHLITTGVGGMIVTDNKKLNDLMRILINHGRSIKYTNLDDDDNLSDKQFHNIVKSRFDFVELGYSYRITEMEAAVGLSQIEDRDKIIEPRRKNADYLRSKLSKYSEYLQFPEIRKGSTHSFMTFPIVIKKKISRDKLALFLEKNGIETRHFLPLLNQPIYKDLKINVKKFPVAKKVSSNGFYIGSHQNLTKADLDYVVDVFDNYFKEIL